MKTFSFPKPAASAGSRAFTLVEMLVSTAVLSLIMVLLLSTVDQTQRIWSRTAGKISQFQTSRSAFDALTRNLSQATLNTYYDLTINEAGKTDGYTRASDLHFISGKASQPTLLGGGSTSSKVDYPTHAVFFQAPLGITAQPLVLGAQDKPKFRTLNSLLNAVGYFIKWGEDETMPDFLKEQVDANRFQLKYRSRLMEVIQPSEELVIFNKTKFAKTTDWIQVALGNKALETSTDPTSAKGLQNRSHVLADNVVALVILPKRQDKENSGEAVSSNDILDLAPTYEYDSRPAKNGTAKTRSQVTSEVELRQFNQMPPVVQVTMVAIDEPSAQRQADYSTEAPEWTNNLFTKVNRMSDLTDDIGDPSKPVADTLTYRLSPPPGTSNAPKMNYRIYTMDVVIRGAKWSETVILK